jgi:prepilin-type N-terminal cleavage/methylation domain-containing protein
MNGRTPHFGHRFPRITGRAGFSMAELLVVVVISAFLMAGIYTVLVTGKNSWEINRDRLEIQQELRKGLDWMRKDLRQAGVSTVTGTLANGTASSTITFQTPSGVVSGAATWNAAVQYHLGGTGNTRLLRTTGGVDRIIAQDMYQLQFTRTAANPSVVQISATARKNTPQHGLITITVATQERMRN